MATTYYTDIQKLYVAYFNRPADPAGLAYWENVVEVQKGSTAAVAAQFAAEAEYKTAYAGMSNADIVATVYLNLFGRVAESAGKAYWADLLDRKILTIDKVVTQIAAGAQGSDATAYGNKVAAALAFTAAVDTTAELAGYNGDAANVAAKAFISSVTDNASLTAAVAPATLNASVAIVVAAGTPFTLNSGLVALNAATAARTAFLVTADGDADATTSATPQSIAGVVTTKMTALDTLVAGDYTGSSVGVRAALLADQQAANTAKLTADAKLSSDAQVAILKVAGLSTAIATLDASKAANTAAIDNVKLADADLAAKVAAYGSLNGTTVTVNADGSVAGVITLDTNKNLVLATGVTEAKNPGVTALLASSVAHESTDATATATAKALVSAQTSVDGLDLTAQAKTDLTAIASAMTIVKLDAGTVPSAAQITTELTSLDALDKSAAAIAAQSGATQAQIDAASAAHNKSVAFAALVTTFTSDDNANPLVAADAAAKAQVTADNTAISNLSKAIAALDAANSTAAQLAATDSTVKMAQDAFTGHSLMLPVTLTTSPVVATAGADIYVFNKTDATIINFGLLGKDSLFIGTDYTLSTGKLSTGNNAVLEAFVAQSGTDTTIKLEKTVFGSNAAAPEVVTITLTGVDASHVSLSNGIITIV